jgi:hypothetical protein
MRDRAFGFSLLDSAIGFIEIGDFWYLSCCVEDGDRTSGKAFELFQWI